MISMIRTLRILAIVIFLAMVVIWAAMGANLGWTKTKVATVQVDPVTEIEFPTYEDRFVPGVEFLIAGIGAATVLFTCSVVLARFSSRKP